MNQYGNDYIEEIQNEHQRSFEFDEYPQFQEYYSNQISSGFKKPKKIIVTEIFRSDKICRQEIEKEYVIFVIE